MKLSWSCRIKMKIFILKVSIGILLGEIKSKYSKVKAWCIVLLRY